MSSSPTAPPTSQRPAPEPASEKRRKRLLSYSTKNMIYSVLAVFALAFVAWAFFPSEGSVQRQPAEVDLVAAQLAATADYQVYVPHELGPEWTVTTARVIRVAEQDTWRLGAMIGDRDSVALSQAIDPSQEWLDSFVGRTGAMGEQQLPSPAGEQPWQVYQGASATVLVLEPFEGQLATTVVHGNVSQELLVEFVDALTVVDP